MKTKHIILAAIILSMMASVFTNYAGAQNNGIPSGWEYVTTSSNPHGIIIMLDANPRINDIPIQAGDYIGAFFTDENGDLKCAGADFWLGDANIIFTVNGDEASTPEKDGFAYAEQMYYKVYSWSNHKEYDVDVYSFSSAYYGTDHWVPLGLSAITNLVCNVEFDAFASASPNPVCLGNEITLSANIFVGTTGNYTYIWSSQPEGLSSTNPEIILIPEISTVFTLLVSDGVLTSSHELTVEVNENPVIEAGEDITICPMGCAPLSSSAQNFSSVNWETNGDGTFSNQCSTCPTYFPGETDILNGNTNLTATANPLTACNVYASDDVEITIQSIPTIGVPTELSFCGAQNIIIDAVANNYSTINWSSNGDGTFDDPTIEEVQYFPGSIDLQLGEFTLNICASAILPGVDETCSQIHVEIIDAPTVFAPASQSKCDNLPIPVTCIPKNYSGLLWTTVGDGTFENAQIPSTKYYAGEQDKLNGSTLVTVNVFGESACETFPVSKNIIINLNPSPKVDAGEGSVLCTNQNLQLNGSVENYTYFMWTTSGDGNFSNMIAENPIYYPGANDLSNGDFTLTLVAYSIYPCTGAINDELYIEIVGAPSVEIAVEDNLTFPSGAALEIACTADDFQSILWETTGDGEFDDPSNLSPLYTPGTNDATGNDVVLSVTAFAATNCGADASDEVIVAFTQMASVSAGSDVTACETGVDLNASSQFCNSFAWETNGDGVFSEPSSETTLYIPGSNDILNGIAEVCINGFYGENQSVSDCITVSFISNPLVQNNSTQTEVCYNEVAQLEIIATNYSSIFWYTTNGGGQFSSNGNTTNTYNPSPAVDYPQGCITIFVLAQPLSPCSTVAEESFDLCFIPNPLIQPNTTQAEVCYNEAAQLEIIATNYSSIFWYTTNGGGQFSSNGNTTNTYNPSPAVDYPQGCITIFVLAQSISPCSTVAEESFDLCFIPNPTVCAGDDVTITEEESFTPMPTVCNQSTILWETSGDGYFSDATLLNPEYFPGNEDISNGNLTLTITAFPAANCNNPVMDQIDLTIHRVQTIYIPAGWSGFSSYIENEDAIENVFAPIADYLITAQTLSNIYWPEGGINTIGNFSNTKGYKVKMSEGHSISISGKFSTSTSIELTEGWNIIPILSSCYISQYDIVNQFGGTLQLMKEIGGNGIIWPDLNIYNLTAVTPGNAYLVAVSQNTTLTFDACDAMKSSITGNETSFTNNTPWETPEQTTISHSIAFEGSALDNFNTGDFLGAFNEQGICVGITEVMDGNQNFAITVFGDEAMTTNTEGMEEGEIIEFRIYDTYTQTETPVEATYSREYMQANGTFTENGLSVVENTTIKAASIYGASANAISLYPNPSKGMVTFNAENNDSNYHITISDMSGHVIIENDFTGSTQMDLSVYPKGFFMVIIKGDTYHSTEKLILE